MKTTKEQREARRDQGYHPSPEHKVCGTCGHMTVKDLNDDGYYLQAWCSAGDFPTKRTATCRDYLKKQEKGNG